MNLLQNNDKIIRSMLDCEDDLMHKKKKKVSPVTVNKLNYLYKFFRDWAALTLSLENQKDYFMTIQEVEES